MALFIRFFCSMLVLALLSSCAALATRTVRVSATDIQNKIAENLKQPIMLLNMFEVSLSNPVVKLDELTGRLNTTLSASIVNPISGTPLKGQFSLSGVPRFDASSNRLVLSKTKIENINVEGANAPLNKIIKTLVDNLDNESLNDILLYTVKADDLKVGATTYTPTEFKVVGNQLQITLKSH